MRTTSLIASPLVTVAASVGAALLAGHSTAAPAPPAGVRTWEYKTVSSASLVNFDVAQKGGKTGDEQWTENVNKLGADGWELLTVNDNANGRAADYYFKRPK